MVIRTMLLTGALLLFGWPVFLPAGMITIDFESVAASGGSAEGFIAVPSPFEDQGFTLSNDGAGFRAPRSGNSQFFAGSTGLVSEGAGSTVELSRTDGGLFNLLSIDFSEWPEAASGVRSTSVTLNGITASGTVVTETLTLNGVFDFETFSLAGFTDLLSVSWTQNASEFVQFDDIVLSGTAVGGVTASAPEPSSFALLGLGALGLIGFRRRRKDGAA